ncbi:sensor histidine kinase [Streptomyces collinus]|uniref:sensor histidine kinase n=1 Tax=Streptomyces collinus TaxID=42684 RepID=UPI001F39E6F8|nr:sensor histidine kinase [Streptomyces collinus]UJA11156.1 HAMP domain-containing histidine kinase [Streptomyces collinus]
MSTNEVDAPARRSPVRSGMGGFADRWPFRRKLNLLVGIPLAVVAVLLWYLVTDLMRQSDSAESAARTVRDSAQVARLVDRLEAEHQQAILLSARYESGYATPSLSAYRGAQTSVDAQAKRVRATFGDRLTSTGSQALKDVDGLSSLRQSVERGYLPADNIDPAYTDAAGGLIDGLGLDRDSDLASTFTGNLLDSLLRADAAHGAFETSVFSATTGDTNALLEFTHAVGSNDLYRHQSERFGRFATERQARQLAGMDRSAAQQKIAQAYADLQIDPTRLEAGSREEIRQGVRRALTDYPDYSRQAAARLEITTSLIGQIADRADADADSAEWRAGLLLYGALLGLALWIAFSVLVRRSVVRPVQALTEAAREVEEVAGRELARVADDDAEDDGPPRLRDMPVTARDEIGDLAEAFNRVQTTAAALLARQVVSRRNTAEMFGNVGRRVSNLTTRQLALLDSVERGETDPVLLERLYSIDHIAVRLRRNADSLMLLAGIRETALDGEPLPLSTVVRAALGQIEGYPRVRLYAASDAMVEPDVIGDLTLMTAELLENAVSFSPEGSPVEVTVRSGPEGAHIVVTDHGLGMSSARLAEENARLIRRERLDLVPTKVLGLFVVGALARRWEIGVELTRTPGGGVTAEVTLPASLLLTLTPVTAAPPSPVAVAPAPADAASGPIPSGAEDERHEPAGELPRRRPRRDAGTAGAGTADADVTGVETADAGTADAVASGTTAGSGTTGYGATGSGTTGSGTAGSGSAEGETPAPGAVGTEAVGTEAPAAAPEATTPGAARPAAAGTARSGAELPAPGGGARTLRRRVRGATLRTTAGAAQVVPQAAPTRDAEAERSELEEFEAAVARAHRDSDTGTHARPPAAHPPPPAHDQIHLPEGAEQ